MFQKMHLMASIGMFSISTLACATTTPLNSGENLKVIIRSDYKPNEITQLCKSAIQSLDKKLSEIVAIKPNERTVQNTLLAFEALSSDFSDAVQPLTFMAYVSPNTELSKEASECEKEVGKYAATISTRKDLYEVLKSAPHSLKDPKSLQRLRSETLKSFEDNGMHLSTEQLKQLTTWKQELAELESQFSENLNQDKSTVQFTQEELSGVPEDFVKSLTKSSDGKFIVTTKEPHYVRIMDNATRSDSRKKMITAYENRAAEKNPQLIEQAIEVRQKIAGLLGYKTWADYRVHRRMAKDAATINTFLSDLRQKLSKKHKQDLAELSNLKKETEKTEEPLAPWDLRFYSNLLLKKKFDLDPEKVREYFPTERVISEMFAIYSTLFGVTFVEVKDGSTWHPSVKLYEVRNTSTRTLIGYFFADFFPREGKYGHAAAFPLISGRRMGKDYSKPVASIVANFSAPENGKPSLMPHEEVDTIFHEFGHIMHMTLTRAPFASLSGSSVDQDFVEAPSQMLENWVFESEILKRVSKHFESQKPLPKAMIKKLVAKRDFNQGYFYTRQIMLAMTDMAYSTTVGHVDTTQVFRETYKNVMGFEPTEGSHFQAGWTHLMGGYDAGYYGYLWSEVFASDMFTRFQKEGLLNAKTGMDYRKAILEPGKMRDAHVILRKFLGRNANNDAFLKRLHISTADN